MIVILVAAALAAAAFGAVSYPLWRDRRTLALEDTAMPTDYGRALEDLGSQRDSTYAAIKELDFDQEMGILPDTDYQELRERYRRKAAGILRDLDELQAAPVEWKREAEPEVVTEALEVEEDEIEREVRRRRGRRRARPGYFCQACRAAMDPEDCFCRRCGTPLATCPTCGGRYQPGDRFCPRCGGDIEEVAQ